jgi:hypothetical protein
VKPISKTTPTATLLGDLNLLQNAFIMFIYSLSYDCGYN